jgi:hypothetical protein
MYFWRGKRHLLTVYTDIHENSFEYFHIRFKEKKCIVVASSKAIESIKIGISVPMFYQR